MIEYEKKWHLVRINFLNKYLLEVIPFGPNKMIKWNFKNKEGYWNYKIITK